MQNSQWATKVSRTLFLRCTSMTITPLWTLDGCPTRWSLLLIYLNFSVQITETYSKVLLNPHHLPIISIHHTKCVTVQQNASSETITVQYASHTSSWSLQNPFSLFLHLGAIFYTILGFIRRSQVCEMAFRILRKSKKYNDDKCVIKGLVHWFLSRGSRAGCEQNVNQPDCFVGS